MHRFLAACRGAATEEVPVWFMRQAGRSLPEYRELRASHRILDMCRTPDLAVEVTLQPVRRHGVDAAILFSDIVVPFLGMGIEVEIEPGVGPVIASPVRDAAAVAAIAPLDPYEGVPYVLETVGILAKELRVPLIGFGGAPFTLASYLIEGGPSKTHARTKALMFSEPDVWENLMSRLAGSMLAYLRAQVEAGAEAIQLFDSWVGHLSAADYERYVLPHVRTILEGLDDLDVPRILFGVGTGELLGTMGTAGADVVGVDWRVPLDDARVRTGGAVLQGNLDPAVLLAPWEIIRDRAVEVLRLGGGRGHIFNLGHGVLPETPPDALTRLVDLVHSWSPDDE